MNIIDGKWASLRWMQHQDDDIVSWRNRPEAAKWLVQWEPLTVEKHQAWFQDAQQKGDKLFVFLDRLTQEPIGSGSLYNLDDGFKQAEWGRLCSRDDQHNPFALVEACFMVQRFGFEKMGLKRLICECATANFPANRVNRFVGYKEVGVRKMGLKTPSGTYDVFQYNMEEGDFLEAKENIKASLYKNAMMPEFS